MWIRRPHSGKISCFLFSLSELATKWSEFVRDQMFAEVCVISFDFWYFLCPYRVILQSSAQSCKSVTSDSPSDNEDVRRRTRTVLSSKRESRWVLAWRLKVFILFILKSKFNCLIHQSHIVQMIFSLPFHSLLLRSRLARSLVNLPVISSEKSHELYEVTSLATDKLSKKSNIKCIIPINSEPLGPSIPSSTESFVHNLSINVVSQ